MATEPAQISAIRTRVRESDEPLRDFGTFCVTGAVNGFPPRVASPRGGSLAAEVFDSFADGGEEHGQAFADGFGVSREIQDQAAAAGAGGGAGEDGGGDGREAHHAHDFAEAREFAFEHGAGCLRGDVTWCGAGAAGGDDEVACVGIAEADEELFDFLAIVRDHLSVPGDSGAECFAEDAFDFRAAAVLIDSGAGSVAQGDACDFHDLVFSNSLISPISMSLSTALHIS